jgi:hypothetical protein
VADLIQDLLICMEMLVASIAFLNSFPIMEFAKVRQLNWDTRGKYVFQFDIYIIHVCIYTHAYVFT